MKSIVIVAPEFPPCNLTAGHRSRLLATYLPEFGWKPTILTVQPKYYETLIDEQLTELVPDSVNIIRTSALPVEPVRIVGNLGIRSLWWHYRELCKLAKVKKIDFLYIPIPPGYSAMLGPVIYKRFGIPYGIDYIDPWVHRWPGTEKIFSKHWLAYHLNRILEPVALKYVSLVTGVAERYYEGAVERNPHLKDVVKVSMPYGGDITDHRFVERGKRKPFIYDPEDELIHLVYAGALLPKAFGTLRALCEALLALRNEEEVLFNRLKLHFIGTGTSPTDPEGYKVLPIVKEYGLSKTIDEHPDRIPYLDAIAHQKYADCILILGSSETHYTPSKVFQAILSERPILALLHQESTGVKIIRENDAGKVVTFSQTFPVEKHIDQLKELLKWAGQEAPGLRPKINEKAFKRYSARNSAKILASALDRAC